MDIKKAIGKRILERRNQFGWTRSRLAELTGYSSSAIKNLEDGSSIPAVDTLLDISKVLKTDLYYFIQDIEGYYLPDLQHNELSSIYNRLNMKNREILINYARYIDKQE